MSRAGRELLMRAEGGLPNLAVISSVAPFIGLFGAVWGIMTSFAIVTTPNSKEKTSGAKP
jgi:biopolymer transport protein ExbB/TolQ